jgi:hypothetical protein
MADPTTGLPPVRTDAQLGQQATSQVDTEIQGQVSPLQSLIGSLQQRQKDAVGEVGNMFSTIQPYVAGSAKRVEDQYATANRASAGIFAGYGQQLQNLRQSRAAEAQTLAQQMGGPVSLGEFTASVDPSIDQFIPSAAGALQHGLANAEIGSQEAEAFAGRVFPLLQTELTSRTRADYEEQIKTQQDKIDAVRGQRMGLINSRLNDLQTQERQYALGIASAKLDQAKFAESSKEFSQEQNRLRSEFARTQATTLKQLHETIREFNKNSAASLRDFHEKRREADRQAAIDREQLGVTKAQLRETKRVDTANIRNQAAAVKLDTLKAQHDWTATQHTLANDDTRLTIQQQQADLAAKELEATLTGTYKDKPTEAAKEFAIQVAQKQKEMTAQERQWAAQNGLTNKAYAIQWAKLIASGAKVNQQVTSRQQLDAMKILDAAVHPAGNKPVLQSVRQEITKQQALLMSAAGKTAWQDANGSYYTWQSVRIPPDTWSTQTGNQPLRDPNQAYHMIVTDVPGISPKMAANIVRQKMTALGVKIRDGWTPGNEWRPADHKSSPVHRSAGAGSSAASTPAEERGPRHAS